MADRPKTDFTFEPELDDMLDDPVVQAMMDRDGVERDHILDLAASFQERFPSDDDDAARDNAPYRGDEEDDWYAH
jgi:hypothetical protein